VFGWGVTVREKRLDNPGRPYITGTTDNTFFRSVRYAAYACREDGGVYSSAGKGLAPGGRRTFLGLRHQRFDIRNQVDNASLKMIVRAALQREASLEFAREKRDASCQKHGQ
jgi:hypothetical protein